MQIVRDLAGYSLGRSDLVRRAMSKKKHKVMEEERYNFINGILDKDGNVEVAGCIRNGISEEAANRIFDSMMDFASYAFNKSHAAAYAVIGFQTAYLMHYFPTEFIAAMLNSIMGISEKVAYYTRYATEVQIEVFPPDINQSFSKFAVEDNGIRFGLAAVKNVGTNVIESIVKSRETKGKFTSLMDFCSKIDMTSVNKRAVESLIKAGAFDSLKVYRSKLIAVYEKVMDGKINERKKNIDGQMSLFVEFKDSFSDSEVKYPEIKEFDKKYLLAMEKEMTGLYISGHPLDEYKETLNLQTNTIISDLMVDETIDESELEQIVKIRDGDKVIIGGIITEVSKKLTKNNDMMAFIRLEDLYGNVEVIIFPKVFEKCSTFLQVDGLIVLKGRVSIREDEQPKVLCESLEPLIKLGSERIFIQIEEESLRISVMKEIKPMILNYKGDVPLYLCTKKERKKYRLDRDFWIDGDSEILSYLRNKFGDENVKKVNS